MNRNDPSGIIAACMAVIALSGALVACVLLRVDDTLRRVERRMPITVSINQAPPVERVRYALPALDGMGVAR